MAAIPVPSPVTLHPRPFRGPRRLRFVLVGLPGSGKRTLFEAVSSAAPETREIAGTHCAYRECTVRIGLDEASLVEVPACPDPPAELVRGADAIIQVADAARLEPHLALARSLRTLGVPLVMALNRIDLDRERGDPARLARLSASLAVPIVPTIALMGLGLDELFEAAVGAVRRGGAVAVAGARAGWPDRGWRFALDALFLHPRWGLVGSVAVFAAVLYVVFWLGAWLDAMTAARMAEAIAGWKPEGAGGVVARAVADALVGLTAILIPYMIPLVLLLVGLEQSGIMHRIAFVVDRAFHRIGLHGTLALPFLTGLGCNVPAIVNAAQVTGGRERVIASVLITFVPCSARSAIILAVAGKYLGVAGVLALFAIVLLLIAALGRFLARDAARLGPGRLPHIPPFALPRPGAVVSQTWRRSRDVLTIVMPLLVAGSVVLALLAYHGLDDALNAAMSPVTALWLGLPVALGVPLVFGILRKELSLLLMVQALATADFASLLDATQLMTLLAFLTLYVPCLSTFAVMLRTIGARDALRSVGISIGAALVVAGMVRAGGEAVQLAARWLA